jgi:2-polyprenyl-6-methoxyphenol hydroxylase-like FAD-dependent oxidoreductase
MIDFFGSGYDVAGKMGLLEELARIHCPIARLSFVDGSGKPRFSIEYDRLRELFRGRHYNFMRGDLERVLYEKVQNRVDFHFATSVRALEQNDDRVDVTLTDGSTDSFDLVVGADGVHSHVRRLAFGDAFHFERFLGYACAAFTLDPVLGVEGDSFATLTEPHRQVSIYPIRGCRLATLFLHRTDAPIAGLAPDRAAKRLAAAFDGMDWLVPVLIDRMREAPSLFFDDITQIEIPSWSHGRTVLLGDACWCVSLLAGQGASLAMAGAYLLARELSAYPGDVGFALTCYERQLKPAIMRKQRAGRRMAKWFVPENQWQLALRDLSARMSTWPVMRPLLRSRLGADSVLK